MKLQPIINTPMETDANKFKLDMVRIEGPEFPYPNYVIESNDPMPIDEEV